jgi:hypothetical protein
MQAMERTNATKLKCKDIGLKEKNAYYETFPHHLVSRVINYSRIDNDMTIQHSTSSKPSKFKAQSFNAHAPNRTM